MEGALNSQAALWDMVMGAGPMVKFVLIVLFFLSVVSWAIIIFKLNLLRKIDRESTEFYEMFWKSRQFYQIYTSSKHYRFTPLAKIFSAIYSELSQTMKTSEGSSEHDWPVVPLEEMDRLKRVIKRTSSEELINIERTINFLATTGNTAPFIGLFGTVWGIMNSFRGIGLAGSASLAVVAPGISEALVATAMGLFAAIPAVVGYNHILSRRELIAADMDNFSSDILNIVDKEISKNTLVKSEHKGG